jgi:hypothetical protein
MIWDIDLIFGMWAYSDELPIKFEFCFTMLWDIDLIFGMWVYSDELPIKFEFCFTMLWDIDLIFGMWVYSDDLPIKFEFCFTMLWDIDLIFGIRNYNDELQIKFSFCSHWIILAKLLSLDLSSSAFQNKWPTTINLRINIEPCFHWRTFAINNLQWLLLLRSHDTFNSEKNSMTIKR